MNSILMRYSYRNLKFIVSLFKSFHNRMKTLTLDIPDSVNLNEQEIKMLLAGQLYENGKLTLGEAATLAGLSKRAFIEVLGKYGFSVVGDSTEDLHSDIENA